MENSLKKHPIQLSGLVVKELFIRVNNPNAFNDDDEDKKFSHVVGHSDFDSINSSIDIGVIVSIGDPDKNQGDKPDSKFDLRVNLLAKFNIDTENFPENKIEQWAKHNAPLVLYPYIREHVHALSIRAGIRPILLPLMEVPTLLIKKT